MLRLWHWGLIDLVAALVLGRARDPALLCLPLGIALPGAWVLFGYIERHALVVRSFRWAKTTGGLAGLAARLGMVALSFTTEWRRSSSPRASVRSS